MKDRVGVRLAVAAVLVGLGCTAVVAALISGFGPRHFGVGAPNGHELGQLLGLADEGVLTPIGIYRESLRWLPAWLRPPVARLLHVQVWVWALILLPIHTVLASLAFDWAVGGGPALQRSRGDDL